jgi:regulator of sigma D
MSAWEQIAVVIVFTLLLAGIGYLSFRAFTSVVTNLNKAFTQSVADINKYYAAIIEKNNQQWQMYFDARSESSKLVNDNIIEKLEKLTQVIDKMDANFTAHDVMERQALADMAEKRRAPTRTK